MVKKITEQTFEVKYTGILSDAENVFLHYGYSNWENVSESKMRKLKSGYKTEITMPVDAELNFCFRDAEGAWDNNYGNDYFFTPNSESTYSFIEVKEKSVKAVSTTTKTSKTTTKTASTKTSPATIKTKATTKSITKK